MATGRSRENEKRVKRKAGQHALLEGRKRVSLWKVVGVGASVFNLKALERHAAGRVREARRTWVAGGEAEVAVGNALEGLLRHGFYVYHDVQLPGIGNVDHVAIGPSGVFAIETKSHRGKVRQSGGELLLNGKPADRDFVSQAWRGAYALKEITGVNTVPVLCFTRAFVEGRVHARGVRAVPLKWLNDTLLTNGDEHGFPVISRAVSAVGAATGTYPSAAPRRGDT